MQKKLFSLVIVLFISLLLASCSDNPVQQQPEVQYDLIYERSGLIDSLYGDCSGTLVRTNFLDEFDLTNVSSVKFEFDAMTDADMSSFEIFYTENGINHILINMDAGQMNIQNSIILNNPGFNAELKTRITLNSSVCTGQIFYAKLRNVRISVN
jgi:hypothetical protein